MSAGIAGTMESGRVRCHGGGIRWAARRLWGAVTGRALEEVATSWYMRVEEAEVEDGQRDSFVVEGRSADGDVVERRQIRGILYDGETGEEEEWVMELGTERERRIWAIACRANEEKMAAKNELGVAVAEVVACRQRLGLWRDRADEYWIQLQESRALVEETQGLLDQAYDIIAGAEEQLDAAMLPVIHEEEEEEGDSGVEDEFLEVEESDGEEWDEGQGLLGGGVVAAAANYVPGRWSRLWGWVAGWFGFGGREVARGGGGGAAAGSRLMFSYTIIL